MIALRNKPGGRGGINPFVTVVLHGGGGSKCGLSRVT